MLTLVIGMLGSAMAQTAIPHRQLTLNDSSWSHARTLLATEYGPSADFERVYRTASPTGIHSHYAVTVEGYRVHQVLVQHHRQMHGKAVLSFPEIPTSFPPVATTRSAVLPEIEVFDEVYAADQRWVNDEGEWKLVWVVRGMIGLMHTEVVYKENGSRWFETDWAFKNRDTTIASNVYLPDPITASQTTYGSVFEDSDDANLPALETLLVQDSIEIHFDSTLMEWVLENDYVRSVDLGEPFVAPPTSPDAQFSFNRSEYGFEYVNALYHITRYQLHLHELGFDLTNYQIQVDAHGQVPPLPIQDQSQFVIGSNPESGRLYFGDGGVDDAEDADVIVHEYTHALSYSASPGTVLGAESQAIEEAICDFMALSYSRAISDFEPDRVFNWDGHNEFWPGRDLTYSRTYPSDLEDDLYLDAPIWTSALADVHDYYGREVSEMLVLSAMFYHFPNMHMTDAAQLILKADTLLYEGAHADVISIIFCNRGLLKGCEDTLIRELPLYDPYVGGTAAYAFKQGPLRLFSNAKVVESIQLFDLQGRLITTQDVNQEVRFFYELDLPELPSGIYLLQATTTDGAFSFKIVNQRMK